VKSKLGPPARRPFICLLYLSRVIVRMENLVELRLAGETEVLGRKPAPAPLCPPQIPLNQTQPRTRAAAVGSQRLTAWVMARPLPYFYWISVLWSVVLRSLYLRVWHFRMFCSKWHLNCSWFPVLKSSFLKNRLIWLNRLSRFLVKIFGAPSPYSAVAQ
jgi:hypothetical protein